MTIGTVYIARSSNGYLKFGTTKNPRARFAKLRSGDIGITILHQEELCDYEYVDLVARFIMRDKKVYGYKDWFRPSISLDQAIDALSIAKFVMYVRNNLKYYSVMTNGKRENGGFWAPHDILPIFANLRKHNNIIANRFGYEINRFFNFDLCNGFLIGDFFEGPAFNGHTETRAMHKVLLVSSSLPVRWIEEDYGKTMNVAASLVSGILGSEVYESLMSYEGYYNLCSIPSFVGFE